MNKIANLIIDGCMGTPTDVMMYVDQLIEDGDISAEEFAKNELDILNAVDNSMFMCSICGWNYGPDEMGEDSECGELLCTNCEE